MIDPLRKAESGFTLLETVVSLLLLSAVIWASTESVQRSVHEYGRLKKSTARAIPAAVARRLLELELASSAEISGAGITISPGGNLQPLRYQCASTSSAAEQINRYYHCGLAETASLDPIALGLAAKTLELWIER